MEVKENFSIRDCNHAYPVFCKSAAGVEFVQMNISFTMTKEAYEILNELGFDFLTNIKEAVKDVYFEVCRCMFDMKDEDSLE